MANPKGIDFEKKFKEDWLKSFPNSLCFKVPNQMSGYLAVNNYCDFICFDGKKLFMLDCKAHAGASFPFNAFPQYERLLSLKGIPNLVTGIILWLYEKDLIVFVPTLTIKKLKDNNIKSFNPKTIDRNEYYFLDVPSIKLRTFMKSDYKCLNELLENEEIENYGE